MRTSTPPEPTLRRPAAGPLDTGHADRPVRVEHRPDGDVVVKRYVRGGAGRVHAEHLALWRSPFGAARRPPGLPRPLSLDPQRQEVTMEHVAGEPLGTRGDPGQSWERTDDVARLLADLHGSGVVVDRLRDDRKLALSCTRKADELRHPTGHRRRTGQEGIVAVLALRLCDVLSRAVERASDRGHPTGLVPSHGDFSPRNVLDTPDGLVLIDLDRLQMARPERDVAYWGAWMWTTELLAGRTPSWYALSSLVPAYAAATRAVGAPWGALTGSGALAWHQAASLLRIAHGWSALAERPDLRAAVLREGLYVLGQRG